MDRARSIRRMAEKDLCASTFVQSVAAVPRAPRVHEVRGRPRKQPDLPVDVRTVPPIADESHGVLQHFIPSSSSGHVAPTTQAAGGAQVVTAPEQATQPIRLDQTRANDSDALQHAKAPRAMHVYDLDVEHVSESPEDMREVADSVVPSSEDHRGGLCSG